MKTLIIICEDNELNAAVFKERCESLGLSCVMLVDSGFGSSWTFTHDSTTLSPRILDKARHRVYALDDENYCFHFRSPNFATQERLRRPYSHIVECLYTVSYDRGLFLHSLRSFDFDQCKPMNLRLSPRIRVPETTLTNDAKVFANLNPDSIIKGMSITRTQAVALQDGNLRSNSSDIVHVQKRIYGKDIKVIAYRRKDSSWEILPTIMVPKLDLIDYRFDEGNDICLFEADFPWQRYAEHLYLVSEARFFDFDFKYTDEGELVFLEMNPGACGILEERAIANPSIRFSERMLTDWLAK